MNKLIAVNSNLDFKPDPDAHTINDVTREITFSSLVDDLESV